MRAILDDEVNTAVEAYLATPNICPFPIANGYRIDIAAVFEASQLAGNVLTKLKVDNDQTCKAV